MDKELLKSFQQSWAKHKYWVMARDQNAYNEIRLLAKNKQWDLIKQRRYDEILTTLASVEPSNKTLRVACQHIWGYFKKQATTEERETYKYLMDHFELKSDEMTNFLADLVSKYQTPYLLNIRWLKD